MIPSSRESSPGVAVPVSLIGTFAVMYLCGYSLDNLSLMAITIATGFVVDDAIVVLENIVRHMEHGMGRMEAALLGSREHLWACSAPAGPALEGAQIRHGMRAALGAIDRVAVAAMDGHDAGRPVAAER